MSPFTGDSGQSVMASQAINMEKETIELAGASTSAIRDFTRVIADNAPRFSFFVFKRAYSGVGVLGRDWKGDGRLICGR